MKLRRIIFLSSLSITVAFFAVVLVLSHKIMLGSYAELEQNHLRSDTQRMARALEAEIQSLDRTLQDYATWDVTYSLTRRPNPNFAKSELAATTMQNLDLRTALIRDLRRKIVFSNSYRKGGSGQEMESDLKALLQVADRLDLQLNQSQSGLVTLSDGPVLVAARPILTTDANGPARGTMLMSRDFDYRLLAKLSNLLAVPLSFRDLQREQVDQDLVKEIAAHGNFAFRPIGTDRALGLMLIDDFSGTPRYLMSIEHDRSIWNTGKKAEGTLALSVLILGLVLCFVDVWGASNTVIKPVETMIQFTRQVRENKELKTRIEFGGSSELSQLARHINAMLDEIQDSNQKLLAARERLQYEATHDALTGAWNAPAALELLDRELARCAREQTTVAVVLFDADHFKSVNDRFGHQAGDTVLKSITSVIGRNLRGTDVLARYGGEEFLVIAPRCTLNEAVTMTQRVLHNLHVTPIQVGDETIQVTLSAGVAAAGSQYTSEDLISIADRAMYRAKEKGRNCVEGEELTHETTVRGNLYAMPRRSV